MLKSLQFSILSALFLIPLGLSATAPSTQVLPSEEDEKLLEDISRRSFLYFWESANPENGLVPDRSKADGSAHGDVASSAATGFGLTALCIGAERGWITREQAYDRALATLKFFAHDAEQKNGFFYHFLNTKSGKRVWESEASSIDTWLLLSGALTVRQYFPGTEAARLATLIYERVDWPWMLNGKSTLSMGWKPESGFIEHHWDILSENTAMVLMAIGSPTHPLSPEAWEAFSRESQRTAFGKYSFLQYPPLFIHQFPNAWVDFRGRRDKHLDYWENARVATLAHKEFCESLAGRFPVYSAVWGISSSDGEAGYMDWGGPPVGEGRRPDSRIDGTIVPYASAGSMPFAPEICLQNLKLIREKYGRSVWKKYGFVDAFNPVSGWVGPDVLGIDAGITLLMIENHRTGFVWATFMKNEETARAMDAVGLEPCPARPAP